MLRVCIRRTLKSLWSVFNQQLFLQPVGKRWTPACSAERRLKKLRGGGGFHLKPEVCFELAGPAQGVSTVPFSTVPFRAGSPGNLPDGGEGVA